MEQKIRPQTRPINALRIYLSNFFNVKVILEMYFGKKNILSGLSPFSLFLNVCVFEGGGDSFPLGDDEICLI